MMSLYASDCVNWLKRDGALAVSDSMTCCDAKDIGSTIRKRNAFIGKKG